MTTTPHLTIRSYDQSFEVWPQTDHYSNGRLHIRFWCDEGPFATLTVNLPDQHLNEGEVFVKDWAENADLFAALLEEGWVTPTGREVQSGFVFPKVMRLTGPLSDLS